MVGVLKPRVLVLTSTLPRWAGDSEPRFVLDLAQALRDRFEPLILAPMAFGAARREKLDGIEIRRFAYAPVAQWQKLAAPGAIMPNLRKSRWLYLLVPVFMVAQFVAIVRLLHREHFDVVHCHWIIPQGLVLGLAGLFVRVPPVLVTCHGADAFTLDRGPLKQLKRWLLRRASAVTVVSREIAEHLGDKGTLELLHVPMGVDLTRFVMRRWLPSQTPTLLFVGRLATKKGLDRLIRAMTDRRIVGHGVRLRVVGDGPLRGDLERLVMALGLSSRVAFLGSLPHDAIVHEMQQADLFCAPFVIGEDGDREGTPAILLEAAATGIPIITSDVGGCGDIIEAGHSGWLLTPGNEAALADAIIEAIENPHLASEMASRARHTAENYAWPRIGQRYADILSDIQTSGRQMA